MARRTEPHDPDRDRTRIMVNRLPIAGVHVTKETALCIAAVWECTRIISETLAMLPWRVMESVEQNGIRRRRVLQDSPLDFLLHKRPNDELPALYFKEAIQAHALLWGNGYAEIEPSVGREGPAALHLITPDHVEVKRSDTGRLFYEVTDDAGSKIPMPPSRILHIRGPSWAGHDGYDLVKLARETLATALATEHFTAAFFGNGAHMGGVIKIPDGTKGLSEDGIKNLKASFNRRHRGARRAFGVEVLDKGMEFKEVGVNPENAQLVEAKKFNVLDVCRWFRMPPHKLAHLDQSIKANIESQGIEFVTDTMLPWVLRWEQEGDFKFFDVSERGRRFTKMDLDELMRGDSSARGEFYKTMTSIGALSINEVREAEDRDSIGPDGDLRLVPMNMVSLEEANRSGNTGMTRTRSTDAHILIFEDVIHRCALNESNAVRRLVNKHGYTSDFEPALRDYYESHVVRMTNYLETPMRSLVSHVVRKPAPAHYDAATRVSDVFARSHCDRSFASFVSAHERGVIDDEIQSLKDNALLLARDMVGRITFALSKVGDTDEQTTA